MVIAGGYNDDNIAQRLAQCLKSTLDETSLARVDPLAKFLDEVECNMSMVLGPSTRGDCFAQKLALFDIGISWGQRQFYRADYEQKTKPPQQVVNMLAVGLPVVADSRFAGHKAVSTLGHDAVRLAR